MAVPFIKAWVVSENYNILEIGINCLLPSFSQYFLNWDLAVVEYISKVASKFMDLDVDEPKHYLNNI